MSSILKEIFIFIFTIGNICADTSKTNEPHVYKAEIPISSSNGMIGVASVAGILSRNGRVSSVGGIHFYPSMQNKMPNIDKKYKSSKQNKDLTGNIELGTTNSIPTVSKWRKESNGNMAEGSISFYPGSVSVSSSAVSSSKPGNIRVNDNSWADPFNPMIWPMNEPFNGPPRNIDYSRNIDWIHRDLFNNYVPPNLYLKRTWLYPTFNPFLI